MLDPGDTMPSDAMPLSQQSHAGGSASPPPFFAVSLLKLAVLSVCTIQMYELYWLYRNWQLIKVRESLHISPFWRSFFPFFYCYQCFSRIREYGNTHSVAATLPAGALAATWFIVFQTWQLPEPYRLIAHFSFVPLLPVQAYVNRVNTATDAEHDPNSRFSVLNLIGVFAGGILVGLVEIVTFLYKC